MENDKHSHSLTLGESGFVYADLHSPARLKELFDRFCAELTAKDPALFARYRAYLAHEALAPEALSTLLVEVAPHVSRFVVRLFGVEAVWEAQRRTVIEELGVFRFKDEFVKRRALRRQVESFESALAAGDAVLAALGVTAADRDSERTIARVVLALLDRELELKAVPKEDAAAFASLAEVRDQLVALEHWIVARKDYLSLTWHSYHFPHTLPGPLELVKIRRPSEKHPEELDGPVDKRRARDGFKLTDRRMSPTEILAQVDYCLYCHDRDKDSCSKGLRDNKTGQIKPNGLGISLEGCPLEEKISEMHLIKRGGDSVGALALVCVDNPMCAGTGHRICNDCMKACVFQKQEPVNIPQIETSVLTDVLAMPWGFEIYHLLTRWNPLNARRPYPLPYRGKDVLVVGMGPAGYTLSHHLLNEGFGVVGVDGLKLEPLPAPLAGQIDADGRWSPPPVQDLSRHMVELDERVLSGFGGVSEYGITVRWDKNFLTVIQAILLRREKFRAYGGIRLGGTVTLDDAWTLGFDHVAIAVGAGKPTVIDMENNLVRGVRKASDFLMALQLTGAFKKDSLANLQVRLPALVIGGGLTAIDTATELLAYYVVQCEKILARWEALGADPKATPGARFDAEEKEGLDELLAHGRALRAERELAQREHRAANFQTLLRAWGGVAIAYRKKMTDSPAYRLNHEEVEKALEEGISFYENLNPLKAVADAGGALRSVIFKRPDGTALELAARTVCVAAGTSPNTIYEKEFPGTFQLDKKGFFAPHSPHIVDGKVVLEADPHGFFTSYSDAAGHLVSYYGDNHPRYAGSVVRAMASAKNGYAHVAARFAEFAGTAAELALLEEKWRTTVARLDDQLLATVVAVLRLTPTIVEVVVRAPLAARRFAPGQFYRLQNFEAKSRVVEGTRLTMEGLALTGAWKDDEKGLLGTIVLEMGSSSRLCAALEVGEQVVLMGPTGTATEIPSGETILLAGGGLGNAVLFSIGKALRVAGCHVIYFAAYRSAVDVFRMDDIEAAADEVIWSTDLGPAITPRRPTDHALVGNVVEAMTAYAQGKLGPHTSLGDVRRIVAIGSDRMMRAVRDARRGILYPFLDPSHSAVASINSPMQCMMKEVCAQCLQKHIDPVTGAETVIFSCVNQDQPMDSVDFDNLQSRLKANSLQEKMTNLWLDRLLAARRLDGKTSV